MKYRELVIEQDKYLWSTDGHQVTVKNVNKKDNRKFTLEGLRHLKPEWAYPYASITPGLVANWIRVNIRNEEPIQPLRLQESKLPKKPELKMAQFTQPEAYMLMVEWYSDDDGHNYDYPLEIHLDPQIAKMRVEAMMEETIILKNLRAEYRKISEDLKNKLSGNNIPNSALKYDTLEYQEYRRQEAVLRDMFFLRHLVDDDNRERIENGRFPERYFVKTLPIYTSAKG
jgi:hypothetical protein